MTAGITKGNAMPSDADIGRAAEERDAHLREFASLYQKWLEPCAETLSAIAELEEGGYQVQGASKFKDTYFRVRGILGIPIEKLIRSLHDLKGGRFRPIGEVRDELRRRSGT